MKHAKTAAAFHVGRISAWLVTPLFIAGMVLFDHRIGAAVRDDLRMLNSVGVLPLMAATCPAGSSASS